MSRIADKMSQPRGQRSPSFFWQGVFILLPVAGLAAIGFHTLRQDRLLADAEARQSAQRQADAIVHTLWSRLMTRSSINDFPDHTFHIDEHNELIFPPPPPPLPTPRLSTEQMIAPELRETWNTAFRPGSEQSDSQARALALNAVQKLQGAPLSANLAGPLHFRLGQLQAANGQMAEAIRTFGEVEERFSSKLTESGLPLGPLAGLKRIELTGAKAANGQSSLDPVAVSLYCSNLVFAPTFLSPYLLGKMRELVQMHGGGLTEMWEREFQRHVRLRDLAAAALARTNVTRESTSAITSTADLANPDSGTSSASSDGVPALYWFQTFDLHPGSQRLSSARVFVGDRLGPRGRVNVNAVVSSIIAATTFTNSLMAPTSAGSFEDSLVNNHVPLAWLASRLPDGSNGNWVVARVTGIGRVAASAPLQPLAPFWTELRDNLPTLPEWLGLSVEVAGRPIIFDPPVPTATPTKRAGTSSRSDTSASTVPEILATARQVENGVELLRVQIHLLHPEMVFARQTTRTRLFGTLIGTAAIVAVLGFVFARRAFYRQLQLAAMKSNFVSSVSHELRAPIASVRLMAESLDRGTVQDADRQRDYFRFIVQECRRLGTLIENVLDFARIEQGRKQYEFEPTDVVTLIARTVKLMEPVAAEKQVTLAIQIPEGFSAPAESGVTPLAPYLDGQAIQQALVNLLDNALKHSPTGTVVKIGLEDRGPLREPMTTSATPLSAGDVSQVVRPVPGHGPTLRLFVEDQGPGIPREEHARIFERFYRRGSELRRETQGVGIGLSIVKHIVDAHGGRIILESQPGQGSRFIIELPFNRVDPSNA